MNKFALWFRRVVWLGIIANFALALPALVMPDQMLAMMSLPSASPTMWPSFAALLLIVLSLFYIPGTPASVLSAGFATCCLGSSGGCHLLLRV